MVINRGSRPEVVTTLVEEDYPKMQKMSNWDIDRQKRLPPTNTGNSGRDSYQEPQQLANSAPPPEVE